MNEAMAVIFKDALSFQGVVAIVVIYLLKKGIDSVIENTKELIELRARIDIIEERTDQVPKMGQDIHALHLWKRSVTKEGEGDRIS